MQNQLDQVLQCIRKDCETNRNGVVVLLFVHGWNHSAEWNDSNLTSFREVLLSLSLREAERYDGGEEAGRRILGIYVGWRGLITRSRLIQTLFTFGGRYRAARRIGRSSPLQTSVARIIETTKSLNEVSPVVLVGHSLGAMMLESALASVLDPRSSAGTSGPVRFPDLVLFLNSAAEAGVARQIQSHIKVRKPRLRRIEHEGTSFDGPLFISVASESDFVTKYVFRLGKLRKTDGNSKELFTHRLERYRAPVVCRAWAGPSFGQQWHCLRPPGTDGGKLRIDIDLPPEDGSPEMQGEDHVRFRLTQEKEGPFWIFQMPREIGDGHNDIFNARTNLLMMALMQVSGALMSLAIDYQQTFDPNAYDPGD